MLRFFPFALATLVAAASCSSNTNGSSSTSDSCDTACQSHTDSAIASCESTIETGFWGFTQIGCGAGGSTECPPDIQKGLCTTIDLEFDADDGGTFQVTSSADGVFHLAVPAGNYQACCTADVGQAPTCQSISLADKQKRHVDEETDESAGSRRCFFTVF